MNQDVEGGSSMEGGGGVLTVGIRGVYIGGGPQAEGQCKPVRSHG